MKEVATTENPPTFCEKHPKRETALRCNRCERYICPDCARHTPVGYRCRECVMQQERAFFDASRADVLRIAAVCALYAMGGALALYFLPFFLVALLLALLLGPLAGENARRAIERRRSAQATLAASSGALLGGLAIGGLLGALPISLWLFLALFAFLASRRLRWGG